MSDTIRSRQVIGASAERSWKVSRSISDEVLGVRLTQLRGRSGPPMWMVKLPSASVCTSGPGKSS